MMPRTSASLLKSKLWADIAMGVDHLLGLPKVWGRRLRFRHELANLSSDQMRDTGLDPAVVKRESEKPFWEA